MKQAMLAGAFLGLSTVSLLHMPTIHWLISLLLYLGYNHTIQDEAFQRCKWIYPHKVTAMTDAA